MLSAKACLDGLARVMFEEGLGNIESTRNASSSGIVGCFLAAFLVSYHPGTVFEVDGPQDLILAAQRLLGIFDEICSTIMAQPAGSGCAMPRELLRSYAEALSTYSGLFAAWRAVDLGRVRGRILDSLEAIIDAVSHLSASQSEQRMQLMGQASALRHRLRRIAGAEAVASFDAQYPGLAAEMEGAGSM